MSEYVVERKRISSVESDDSGDIMVVGGTRFHAADIMALSDSGRAQLSDLVQGALPQRNAKRTYA